jgi:diphthine-ammonia ligase
MKKAFVSWSGGKDCCQAAYKGLQQGFQIQYLLNMMTEDGKRSCSHGIASRWIKLQSAAMEIPLLQKETTSETYEAIFSNILIKLKSEGVNYGIFGDIDFNAHREWIERVCARAGIMPILPLWLGKQEKIVTDFVDQGFVTVIVAVQADIMDPEWLGRKIDTNFVNNLKDYDENITPCGEAGEYHTLVIDGPLFKKRLEISESRNVKRDKHWFLDIQKCQLVEKAARPMS